MIAINIQLNYWNNSEWDLRELILRLIIDTSIFWHMKTLITPVGFIKATFFYLFNSD
ncbi:protein of unknown function (plasmid) [Legionella fallonii LLAP-10]|uniref:Uncharacterized protein n=1 Tax=Legionella fallonii LLAP-10 TaxID=1212491 RepID=A0A098GD31_9GAMM|nr:protein of unknown function [Legionella fallonii LLAP-10]